MLHILDFETCCYGLGYVIHPSFVTNAVQGDILKRHSHSKEILGSWERKAVFQDGSFVLLAFFMATVCINIEMAV